MGSWASVTRSKNRFFFPPPLRSSSGTQTTGPSSWRRQHRGEGTGRETDKLTGRRPCIQPAKAARSRLGGRPRPTPPPRRRAPGVPAQVRARGAAAALGASSTRTYHSDSRSHSWSRAKSKLSMVGGVSTAAAAAAVSAAAAAAKARAARALQRKAPAKVHPGRARAAAARPPPFPGSQRPAPPRPPTPGRPGVWQRPAHSPARRLARSTLAESRELDAPPPPPGLRPPLSPSAPPPLPRGGPARCSRRRGALRPPASFSSGRRVCAGEAEARARREPRAAPASRAPALPALPALPVRLLGVPRPLSCPAAGLRLALIRAPPSLVTLGSPKGCRGRPARGRGR